MNEEHLKSHLNSLVRSTNYRGNVQITLPTESEHVDVYSNSIVNRWRLNPWIRYLFFGTFLFILTWPYLFFATKRYAVVEARWPFSVISDDGRKHFTSLSEDDWLNKWTNAIRRAVVRREQRMLTETDLTASDDGPHEFQSRDATVDGMVRFLSAGMRGIGEVNRQLGWGNDE